MSTGKGYSDVDIPGATPPDDDDWPTGDDELEDEEEVQERDDPVDEDVHKQSERGSGHPDPSRASEAERYSYQPWQKMRP